MKNSKSFDFDRLIFYAINLKFNFRINLPNTFHSRKIILETYPHKIIIGFSNNINLPWILTSRYIHDTVINF